MSDEAERLRALLTNAQMPDNATLTVTLGELRAAFSSPETTPAGVLDEAALDVERLARALNASVGTLGWLHLTPPNAVDEWRENARIIAIEYARLAAALGRSGSGGGRG